MSDHLIGLIIAGVFSLPPAYWGVKYARKKDKDAEPVAVAVVAPIPNGKNGLGASIIQVVGAMGEQNERLRRERDECLAREAALRSRIPRPPEQA